MSMRAAVIRPVRPPVEGARSRPATIPMDAWREDDRFVIALDLPGIPRAAIEVEATGRTVTVRAERRPSPRGERARTRCAERAHGMFARRIELADTLDVDRLQARLEDGVLTLTVPIAAAAEPRRITVQDPENQQATAPAAA